MENKTVVISLGGSLIVPDEVDIEFLSGFKKLIEEYVSKKCRFLIITGGGRTCRKYQAAGRKIADLSDENVDWIGIASLTLNAEFTKIIFGDLAHSKVIIEPEDLKGIEVPVIIGGAKEPGHSTDFDAVEFANQIKATSVVNLSNIDYAYDKDPKKFPDAKKIEKTNWQEFRKILPEKWDPGLNSPFDPIAAKRAEELDIEVAILNGKNLDNLRSYFEGKDFIGTVIK
ncbi:MAG: UMP kinase [Parcubacteria group bacterium CG11_big_fil_rev_8_21_14_0_20_39_22]|nr:MAG: UMP kinase [Parcubacteria group bacterium CG11_big_fil_rev_8_21_14_0_20_39_22]